MNSLIGHPEASFFEAVRILSWAFTLILAFSHQGRRNYIDVSSGLVLFHVRISSFFFLI
jgi:hypothetical protein